MARNTCRHATFFVMSRPDMRTCIHGKPRKPTKGSLKLLVQQYNFQIGSQIIINIDFIRQLWQLQQAVPQLQPLVPSSSSDPSSCVSATCPDPVSACAADHTWYQRRREIYSSSSWATNKKTNQCLSNYPFHTNNTIHVTQIKLQPPAGRCWVELQTFRALGCLWAFLYRSSDARCVLLRTKSKDGPISSSSILGVRHPDFFNRDLEKIRMGFKSPWKFAPTKNLLWQEGAYIKHIGILNISMCLRQTLHDR